MKIPPNTEPIAHVSPYRRIDPERPGGRKRVITRDEWAASGATREPDPGGGYRKLNPSGHLARIG